MEAVNKIDAGIEVAEEREAKVKNINRQSSNQGCKVEAGQERQ